jgi:hypothetical protein
MIDSHESHNQLSPVPVQALQQEPDQTSSAYRQDDAPTETHAGGSHSDTGAFDGGDSPTRNTAEILDLLASIPGEFARLAEGKSREALAKPATDGEWGVVEILPHLRDWDEVYFTWITTVLNEESPELNEVDDSLWAIEHDYANEDVNDVLDRFAEHRAGLVDLIAQLEDSDWQRPGIHHELGRLTLHQLADRMCDHDARHLAQAKDALT